jgi:methylenetetrahydrofolate--tRNA-(uracil-5-)-methyltransferase
MTDRKPDFIVVGGGLAGCEAAWQVAERGLRVNLFEMRPGVMTGAHRTAFLGELVCSNSLGSNLPDRASGLLKSELKLLNSLLIDCAEKTAVPAGGALAVDRVEFSKLITQRLENHRNIRVVREEVTDIPVEPAVIASGPLTSKMLVESIEKLTGHDHLFFFDAISPIVSADTIDMNRAFRYSRYERGHNEEGDYINCPLSKEEYDFFVNELIHAERIEIHEIDKEIEKGVNAGYHKFFEGCLPIEILALRDEKALAFGPMRPVGLVNTHNGLRPYAVVQLRQDNILGSMFNMVGFQTNLKFSEQKRIFRLLPGLENAEFLRFGQMHRNTFIYSPACLRVSFQFQGRDDLFFAGQITGVEGYAGNIGTGLLAGINAARILKGKPGVTLPITTMMGALSHYVMHADQAIFQPMKANFGLLPPISKQIRNKRERAKNLSERALDDLRAFLSRLNE